MEEGHKHRVVLNRSVTRDGERKRDFIYYVIFFFSLFVYFGIHFCLFIYLSTSILKKKSFLFVFHVNFSFIY